MAPRAQWLAVLIRIFPDAAKASIMGAMHR
jgi:hypothetical protein